MAAGWFFGPVERAIRAGTDLYVRTVRGLMRARWAVAVVFVGLLGLTYFVYTRVPGAFVPEEDAGYFISIIQAPPGASLDYTTRVAAEAEKILMTVPEIESVFSVLGFSFSGNAPNQGLIFTLLKPFEERDQPEERIQALLPRLRGMLFGIEGGLVIPFAPPGVNIGNFGGFTFEVLDQGGAADIQNLGNAVQALVARPSDRRRSRDSSARSRPTTRSWPWTSTGRRRGASGLPISEITDAMQIYLGSSYVNDFDFNNRVVSRLRAGGQGVSIGSRATSRSTTRGRPTGRWCRLATWSASARRRRHR